MSNSFGIELGNVVPGAVPLGSDKGFNDTFIGHIDCASQRYKAYIKVLNHKQLVNELLVNSLGRRLGLPVPRGFLLRVQPSDLPESAALQALNQEALVFGSLDLKYPSLARRFKTDNSEAIKWLKANCKILDETIIFDDFVANIDRHLGNLLIDGDEIWLIDHGHCFSGHDWSSENLVAKQLYVNKMANSFVPGMTLPERLAIKVKATEFSINAGKIDTTDAINMCHLNQLVSAEELTALESFVNERVNHIANIISERVGIPTLGNVA